jgi:LPS-assembly protein
VSTAGTTSTSGHADYRGDDYTARLNVHAYEMATVSQITPYDKLPQLSINGLLPYHPEGLDLSYEPRPFASNVT